MQSLPSKEADIQGWLASIVTWQRGSVDPGTQGDSVPGASGGALGPEGGVDGQFSGDGVGGVEGGGGEGAGAGGTQKHVAKSEHACSRPPVDSTWNVVASPPPTGETRTQPDSELEGVRREANVSPSCAEIAAHSSAVGWRRPLEVQLVPSVRAVTGRSSRRRPVATSSTRATPSVRPCDGTGEVANPAANETRHSIVTNPLLTRRLYPFMNLAPLICLIAHTSVATANTCDSTATYATVSTCSGCALYNHPNLFRYFVTERGLYVDSLKNVEVVYERYMRPRADFFNGKGDPVDSVDLLQHADSVEEIEGVFTSRGFDRKSTVPKPVAHCVDTRTADCGWWVQLGRCSQRFVRQNCKKSCGLCE